jgi:hypothetical protein
MVTRTRSCQGLALVPAHEGGLVLARGAADAGAAAARDHRRDQLATGAGELELPGAVLAVGADGVGVDVGGGAGAEQGGEDARVGEIGSAGDGPGRDVGRLPVGGARSGLGHAGHHVEAERGALL